MSDSKEVHIYHALAGTGKTHKLMEIIEQHVQEGVPLHRIAFVSFTRAAAQVAKERVCNRFGVDIKEAPHFRTIHSMCFQHLGMKANLMMDTEKYEDFGNKAGYIFGKVGGKRTLDEVDWTNMTDAQLISFEQLYRVNKPQAQWLLDHKIDNIDFVKYCKEYVKYKRTFNYKDFTDLLEDYVEEDLYEDVDIACIDEAQDCSPLQWRVLFKAFRYAKYIYIVGDTHQTIYTFSGADDRILLHMKGQQHYLDTSYRVPWEINKFVHEHIVDRMHDVALSNPQSQQQGGGVKYIMSLSEISKIDFSKTYLFLARNRKFLSIYKEYCEDHCIPYSILGIPLFSTEEKTQFRDGTTSEWDERKLRLAEEYNRAGMFYHNPVIRIDTIHGVKGDEADIVALMPDLSKLTWKEYMDDPNNEHKVFYVGATRARETLYIIEPHSKYYYEYLF